MCESLVCFSHFIFCTLIALHCFFSKLGLFFEWNKWNLTNFTKIHSNAIICYIIVISTIHLICIKPGPGLGTLLGIPDQIVRRLVPGSSDPSGIEPATFYWVSPSKKPCQRVFLLLTLQQNLAVPRGNDPLLPAWQAGVRPWTLWDQNMAPIFVILTQANEHSLRLVATQLGGDPGIRTPYAGGDRFTVCWSHQCFSISI